MVVRMTPACIHCGKPARLHRFWWLRNGLPVCFTVAIDARVVTTYTPQIITEIAA
jgi:hypothetical protein